MAYTILNTDGTVLLLLANNTVDKSSTSLDLVGRNVNLYGEYYNNNLVKLLGNFANTNGNPPRSPLKGQLWYDTTVRRLKVYDNGFKNVSGAIVSTTQPVGLTQGDLWFDSQNGQMYVYANSGVQLVGPAFPTTSSSGWQLPTVPIKNTATNIQNTIVLRSYGSFLGIATKTAFELTQSDANLYFGSTASTTVVSGITLGGDLKVYGNIDTPYQITQRHLSAYFDIDRIAYNTATVTIYSDYIYQNNRIKQLLSSMYPTVVNTATNEPGVLLGTEARVVCMYSIGTTDNNGIQLRRFRVVDDLSEGKSWQPYNLYTVGWTSTLTNIMLT